MRTSVTQRVNGKSVAQYDSIATATRLTGADSSNISKVTQGDRRSAGGFGWESTESVNTRRKIVAIDPSTGNTVAIFNGLEAIQAFTTVRNDRVVEAVTGSRRTAGGLVWRYTG